MFRLKDVPHHDRNLKEDTTFMSSGVTAFTVTEIASAAATSYVCHAMNMLPKMLGQWNQVWVAFREVLSNRTRCDPTVTKSAMIGYLVD